MRDMSDRPAPVPDRERIVSLDVLRGFAVLGILAMNIWAFAMPSSAYAVPTTYGDLDGLDLWVYRVTHVLADLKFMAIFSMLFGAGIVLLTERRESRGESAKGLHYKRMGWLAVFGLAHGYLLWYGDILVLYAVCGLWVYLFRRARPSRLIFGGVALLAVGMVIGYVMDAVMGRLPSEQLAEFSAMMHPTGEQIQAELDAYRGGWLDQMSTRAAATFGFQTFGLLFFGLWRAGGLMLLGAGLYKTGFLSAAKPTTTYQAFVGLAALLGIPIIVVGMQYNFATGWPFPGVFQGTQFNYVGSLLVALGWVSVIMLLCQSERLPWLTRSLAATGKMAFTNYIVQTVICTTIFYGHGFGLYGSVDRTGQLLIVVSIWVFQLVVSPIWLRHFRFGPLEWLWRSLVYGERQPMRRPAPVAPAPA